MEHFARALTFLRIGFRLSFFLAVILAAQSTIVSAQSNLPVAEKTTETNIPGIRIYQSLPTDFDYLHASTDDLARYGLPERPDKHKSPGAYQIWEGLARQAQKRVTVKLVQTNVYNNIKPSSAPFLPGISSIWSGFAIEEPDKTFGKSYATVVAGDSQVPSRLSGCVPNGPHYSYQVASWVGMDGWNSPDVLQTGVTAELDCAGGGALMSVYPWIEWYPAPSLRITSLPFRPGDFTSFAVWVVNSNGALHYTLYLHNSTLNVGASFDFTPSPPSPSQLVGNSIEWIMERPSYPNSHQPLLLPNYGQAHWILNGYIQIGPNQETIVYRPSVVPWTKVWSISMCQNQMLVSSANLLRHGHPVDRAVFHSSTPYGSGGAQPRPCPVKGTKEHAIPQTSR